MNWRSILLIMFDASAIIDGWEHYPVDQFPGLWMWISSEIKNGNILISKVAFDEVKKKYSECANWIDDNDIQKVEVSKGILKFSLAIHKLLGIEGDNYGNGVGENDIIIISSAKSMEAILISNEKVQTNLPQTKKKNYKIPAVCKMEDVGIECINFLEFIKKSKQIF